MQRRLLLSAGAGAGMGAALALSGCAGQRIEGYAGQQPVLRLSEYFNGTVDAYGIFQDRNQQVVKRFTVVMQCSWSGSEGVLDEAFTYSDGTTQRRVWRLTELADGHYRGRADDVVGEASGRTVGNAFQWSYTLRLPVDGTVYDVQLDDWMYMIDARTVLNRATMTKWGVHVGDITLSFTKRLP